MISHNMLTWMSEHSAVQPKFESVSRVIFQIVGNSEDQIVLPDMVFLFLSSFLLVYGHSSPTSPSTSYIQL
jgi:hypothetical protein